MLIHVYLLQLIVAAPKEEKVAGWLHVA